MILMIDNYDSFTYNLVQLFGELGQEVRVFRNDALTSKQAEKLKPDYPAITAVRGRGLLVALEFKDEIAPALVEDCLERGLLVNKLKPNAIRFMPPLIIGKKEVYEALEILDKALGSVLK